MADIFCKLNDLNLSLLGKYASVLSVRNKLIAAKRKFKFWCENVNIDNLACFPLLQNFLQDNNRKMDQFVKSDIVQHLQEPQKTFLQYFSEEIVNCDVENTLLSPQ